MGLRGLSIGDYPPVLTPAQVAELLQLDRETVYLRLEAGVLPGRKVGGRWRIVTERLMAWLAGDEEPEQQPT